MLLRHGGIPVAVASIGVMLRGPIGAVNDTPPAPLAEVAGGESVDAGGWSVN